MLKFLLAGAAVIALISPASASYTECRVAKDTELANRPGGQIEPRYLPVNKGDKIAFRDKYQDWWFVMHAIEERTDYGWLPENVLTRCKKMDGTP
jgi:hypothetical protein